jgi:hypothetical protein
MAINGNNFIVSWDASGELMPIAGGRADEIQVDADIIPVSSPYDGEWDHNIAGRKSWSLSTNWLLLNGGDTANLLRVGQTYEINIQPRTGSSAIGFTGYAILKTCSISFQRGSLISGSFNFVGVGELEAG